ncbi:MAG: hypothetical protein DU429_02460 [Candidatus Tokpelaia sp.]|nr:MAG: hypothetical protein DU430_05210 [Candidatus Tokpelaia sp.]KAA6207346.1 MAG: hypothetical protein DU429_02460 [Candidatus Tokpelaia sp.]KAA6405142.1 hypothetical protein DPQ22_06215 [Candidatus Tokpelaia sp.]
MSCANSARVGGWRAQQRTGARSVQTAPGLDRLACGGGRNKEQARVSCAKCGHAATNNRRK